MGEIEKLSKRNQELTSLLQTKESSTKETKGSLSSNERLHVRVLQVPETSSSEEAMVDLQVNVRGQISQVDMLMRLLEFFKQVHNVSFISMDANTQTEGGNSIHQITFRLRVSQVCTFTFKKKNPILRYSKLITRCHYKPQRIRIQKSRPTKISK